MATQVQFRRGSTAQVAAATPAAGEIVVDTDKDTVVVGDGSTAGGFELARVDGSNWAITNNVGIGTASPYSALTVDTANGILNIANGNTSGGTKIQAWGATPTNGYLAIEGYDKEYMRVDASGNVGIGTTNPLMNLHLSSSGDTGIQITKDGSVASRIKTVSGALAIGVDGANGDTERMRIDSSGDLTVKGGRIFVNESDNGNTAVAITRDADEGYVNVYSSGTQTVEIRGNGNSYFNGGNVGIGTTSPSAGAVGGKVLHVQNSGGTASVRVDRSDASTSGTLSMTSGNGSNSLYSTGSKPLNFVTDSTTRMTLDASGNLLIGKTSADNTTQGIRFYPTGRASIVADDDNALIANRLTGHGAIVDFHKDSVRHGRLGTGGSYFFIAGGTGGSTHSGIRFVNDGSQRPCTNSGGNLDNTVTWGASAARWEEIFSVNGTINTSDRNEKQDIEALSDAEQRVAVAAKGLMRKYRWRNAVAAKGDDARIHFGIIAQDLQDAFTAEGLDAARYAMWCSDTFWVDSEGETYDTQEEAPEGATEKTRLGVRYSELLAFIIAAI